MGSALHGGHGVTVNTTGCGSVNSGSIPGGRPNVRDCSVQAITYASSGHVQLTEAFMPEICVVMDVTQPLSASIHQFYERCELEHGFKDLRPNLSPHLTIKKRTLVPDGVFVGLRHGLTTLVRTNQLLPVTATVLAPAEFEGDTTSTLYLPLTSTALSEGIERTLDFFTECGCPREGYEGVTPHVTLVEKLDPERQEVVVAIAKSIDWRPQLTFGAMVIYLKKGSYWLPGPRITRHD